MLIEFSVANYLSFKDKVTLSMEAGNIKEYEEDNTFEVGKYRLLKSAAIYGANASGKSNLIKAMDFMQNFILNSSKDTQTGEQINNEPFRLSTVTENQASFFEIIAFAAPSFTLRCNAPLRLSELAITFSTLSYCFKSSRAVLSPTPAIPGILSRSCATI